LWNPPIPEPVDRRKAMIIFLLAVYLTVALGFYAELKDNYQGNTLLKIFLSVFWIFALSDVFTSWLHEKYIDQMEK
jgi:hypothetical protein